MDKGIFVYRLSRQSMERPITVAKQKQNKRTLLDDVADGFRQLLDDLDTVLNPQKQKQRSRVPVPVRIRRDRPEDHYPYR